MEEKILNKQKQLKIQKKQKKKQRLKKIKI